MEEENQNEERQEDQEEQELTLDDLFKEEVDSEAVRKEESELLLPQGTYTTTPPFEPKLGRDKNGRPYARLWGGVTFGQVKGKIGYGLSWVRKNAKNFETGEETDKPDRTYKNYLMASKAFRAAYGRDHANVGELIAYLRDYAHRLRVIQTQDGENMVVSISAVREQ